MDKEKKITACESLIALLDDEEAAMMPDAVGTLYDKLKTVTTFDEIQALSRDGSLPTYDQCMDISKLLIDFLRMRPIEMVKIVEAIVSASPALPTEEDVFI